MTSIKNKKENLNNNYDINLEPNNYLPRISKKINKIICCIIFIPTVIIIYIYIKFIIILIITIIIIIIIINKVYLIK